MTAAEIDEINQRSYETVSNRKGNEGLKTAYTKMQKISTIGSVKRTSTVSIDRIPLGPESYKTQATKDRTQAAALKFSEKPNEPYLFPVGKRVWKGQDITTAQELESKNPQAYGNILQEKNYQKRVQMLHAEAEKAGIQIVDSATQGITKGFDNAVQRNSPPQTAIDGGEDYGNALNTGVKSKIDDMEIAGEALGQATVNGTQAAVDDTKKPAGKRVSRRVQSNNGITTKTVGGQSSILIAGADPTVANIPDPQNPGQRISQIELDRRAAIEEDIQRTKAKKVDPNVDPNPGKSQKINNFNRIKGSIANGVKGMGGMGGGMGLMMAGSMVGSMVPGLEGVGMAASLAGTAMMMLPGTVGIVIAALVGVVGIVMSLNDAMEKQKKAAIDLANAQIMSMDKLTAMSEDFGTVSATQARIASEDAKFAGVTQETLNAGKQYLTEMVSGQQIIEDIKTQQSAGIGSLEIGKNIAADMATAVSQGVVTQQQAQEIIAALGSLTGDRSITANASQQFGTYMEDPTKAPGMVASDRLALLQREFANATSEQAKANTFTTVGSTQVPLATPGTATYGSTQNVSNAALGAVAGTMNAYGQAVGGIDAINARADAAIKEAKTTEEISKILKQRNIDLAAQKVIIAETYAELEKQKTTIGATKFDEAFLNSFDKDSDMYNTAVEINKMEDSDIKMQFQADFAGGNMSQATAQSILDAVNSGEALIGYYKLKVSVEADGAQDALISRLLGVPTRAMAADTGTPLNQPTGSSGSGSPTTSAATTVDPLLARLQARLAKQNALLKVISLKEEKINKLYDERKKALEEISKINANIAEQQKGQLDLADALARGDVAAAARAVQAQRATAAAYAQEQQMKALEEQRQNALDLVTFKGKTRKDIEAKIDILNMKIAKREYRTLGRANGGMIRGYSIGGKVMSYMAQGGRAMGTDTVPAMLTPGEFVVRRPAVQKYGVDKLKAINNGQAESSSVYNYSVTVNAATTSNADQIAQAVMQKIKQVEGTRLRGNRY